MQFFEDIAVGERHAIGSHTFTAEEIKRFAGAFDPQPFHTDEAAAEKSHFGRLCASGWHTLAVWMRLNVRDLQRLDREREAAGIPVARVGPSPGFDELKWLKPVYAGDTVSFESEITAKKASRSKPEWGLISFRNIGRNQSGEAVISFIGHVFVERRDKGPPNGGEAIGQ
jgi:acyl dehydratase